MLHFCKFGKIEGNVQYCSICGRARTVECVHNWSKPENFLQQCTHCGIVNDYDCPHNWKETGEYRTSSVITNNVHTITKVLTCQLCGEVKIFEI